jgi:rhamnosyltransferase subunit B
VRYVVTSFGSAGDFLPTLAVARTLHQRGHHVLFVSNPFHAPPVQAAGIEFVPAGEHIDLYGLITRSPELLSVARGGPVLVDMLAMPFFATTYRVAAKVLREVHVDAVIGSNLSFGLFWAALERRVPAVMIAATPLCWLARRAPAQFLDQAVPARLLPWVAGATRALLIGAADHWLRSVARTVGATAIDGAHSSVEARLALQLGTWPELLRPRTDGDPPNAHAVGFMHAGHLGTTASALPEELEAFLAQGSPPVVIGLGSIFSLGSDDVVADAAEACAEIGRRCVVVGAAPRNRALPEGTLVVRYATYRLLFPRAAAIVIHGGAGTTGEALRSGRPSVVVPFGFDQFALGWQVERLGAGVRVPKKGRDRAAITRALRAACEDAAIAARAAEVADELGRAPDGADVAACLVTGLGPRAPRRAARRG